MKVEPMEQMQRLLEIYNAHPCRTLPNAFWKTAIRLPQSRLVVTRDTSDAPSSLAIWEGERLMAVWCVDPAVHPLTQSEIASVPFALVHEKALPIFTQRDFAVQRPYFRLVHTGGIADTLCPPGFAFERLRPEFDVQAVVSLIHASYEDIRVSPEIVKAWMCHPVYNPDLWLWIVDLETHQKAGLGIAEQDPRVPEASLEWIQVLPSYRGKGVGEAIVMELVRRVSGSVAFTTVSGELTNVHQPERLYRRCGFTGEDVWWLLSNAD